MAPFCSWFWIPFAASALGAATFPFFYIHESDTLSAKFKLSLKTSSGFAAESSKSGSWVIPRTEACNDVTAMAGKCSFHPWNTALQYLVSPPFCLLLRWWQLVHFDLGSQSLTPDWSELGVGHKTSSAMSEQEGPPRPQAKPRPEIPPKPSAQPDPAALTGGGQNVSGAKVKSIVSKFNRQDSVSNEREESAVNGSPKVTKIKRLKRPPTVKPKPKQGRASLPLRLGEQAPPLPMKRSRKPKETERVEERNDVDVEGSRSGTVITKDMMNYWGITWGSWVTWLLNFYLCYSELAALRSGCCSSQHKDVTVVGIPAFFTCPGSTVRRSLVWHLTFVCWCTLNANTGKEGEWTTPSECCPDWLVVHRLSFYNPDVFAFILHGVQLLPDASFPLAHFAQLLPCFGSLAVRWLLFPEYNGSCGFPALDFSVGDEKL